MTRYTVYVVAVCYVWRKQTRCAVPGALLFGVHEQQHRVDVAVQRLHRQQSNLLRPAGSLVQAVTMLPGCWALPNGQHCRGWGEWPGCAAIPDGSIRRPSQQRSLA